MSDTPRTDALAFYLDVNGKRFHEPIACVTFVPVHLARELERENAKLREALEYVRGLGEVYSYPDNWNCAKEGGHPPIDAYQRIDLSTVGEDALCPEKS